MAKFKIGDLIEDRICPISWRVLGIRESEYRLEVLKTPKAGRIGSVTYEHVEAVDEFCDYSPEHSIDRVLNKYLNG
jgi:hypothetical protein